jgi:hypothetical protein
MLVREGTSQHRKIAEQIDRARLAARPEGGRRPKAEGKKAIGSRR